MHIQLGKLDYLMLIIYFVFVIGIGWVLKRRMKKSTDFLLSGRSIPAWVTGLAFLSANLGAQEVIGMAASGAKYGIMTSHFYWVGAIPAIVFLAIFMMPFYYGSKARSVPEYLKLRFDEKTRGLNAISFAVMTVFSSGSFALLSNGAFMWLALTTLSLSAADVPLPTMEIDLSQSRAKVSPTFSGLMTEEINHAYDGGLYAELIRNRIFKDDTNRPVHWSLVAGGGSNYMALDEAQPINAALTTCVRLDASDTSGESVGIANEGFWGIPVTPNTTYRASFFAKSSADSAGPLVLSIESLDGAKVYATAHITKITGHWQHYFVTLKTKKIKPATDARFVISTKVRGTYWFNCVSLFPPTWKNRPNGNRLDVMQHLIDLKPKFLRFPGGNYLEGTTVETHFPWKETLGGISQRPGHMGTWGYRSSDGMGLLEFLEWAEDMGAEPVLAVYAGYSLPNDMNKKGTTVQPGPELEPFVQEALDEIEYVSGDANTKWGARRAADGHPAPFPLHYVEIGNEDFISDAKLTYDARFAQFYDGIKAAHPQLLCIATIPVKSRVPDVIDDHYYATSGEMMKLAHKYDNYDRAKPKIFVGEWATRETARTNTDGTVSYGWMPWDYKNTPMPDLHAALGDAAFMTGMERNSDIIVMNCYAPLLTRIEPGAYQWNPNLIGYDSLQSYLSPSFQAQKMFNTYRGDEVAPVSMKSEPANFFYSATMERISGKAYLKVVNINANRQDVRIKLRGAQKVSHKGLLIMLTSDGPSSWNTADRLTKVVTTTRKIEGLGSNFVHSFPPYSVTVLQMDVKLKKENNSPGE